MENNNINQILASGSLSKKQYLPHLSELEEVKHPFKIDFGLSELPEQAGILLIRGARQYGKSTWLEEQLYKTIKQYGPGSAFYLNGDRIADLDALDKAIQSLLPAFNPTAKVHRIFIDEITAIPGWEISLKRLADEGALKNVLITTTGSKATDLRRGSERLPGRKGKLDRTAYLFTPVSYKEFHKHCHKALKEKTLDAYLMSGGSPIACNELATHGRIPDYVIELVRDWVEGEITRSGRNRGSLLNIFQALYRFACTPVGQAKIAREAGLANNTVARGYLDILQDLACVLPSYPWDVNRNIPILRKPCKYHFTNTLVALAYYPNRIRTLENFQELPDSEKAKWYEWIVAQELLRRSAIAGKDILAPQLFWQNKNHEIDFVVNPNQLMEVKLGQANPLEFSWIAKQLPKQHLTIISKNTFRTKTISGVTLEDFLLEKTE